MTNAVGRQVQGNDVLGRGTAQTPFEHFRNADYVSISLLTRTQYQIIEREKMPYNYADDATISNPMRPVVTERRAAAPVATRHAILKLILGPLFLPRCACTFD